MAYLNKNTLLAGILTLGFYSLGMSALVSSTAIAAPDTETPKPRLSSSTFQGKTTDNRYPATPQPDSNGNRRTALNHNHGLWVYDVLINLTADNDNDGHYSTFSVSLDVETNFSPRLVYAVLYLSQNNNPWSEYAVTGNFTVTGSGSADTVQIETNLESGYPSGYYDHYIEVYDAYDHSLLLNYGPNHSHHVRGLPFESYYDDSHYSPVTVSLSFSGAGSFTPYWLTGMIALLVYRRRSPNHTASPGKPDR